MTYNDIFTKFMIEYDKANITSSYPSLTNYEIATILDKAYLAVISQKFTGANPRRSPFEGDVKLTEDLRPLIKTEALNFVDNQSPILNQFTFEVPTDLLYYVSSIFSKRQNTNDYDDNSSTIQDVSLVSHEDARKFMYTKYNKPWIKNPVAYYDGNTINVLVDSKNNGGGILYITYVKYPKKFVDNIKTTEVFECSDSFAEELINQAILFATETTESPRFATKSQSLAFES